MGGTNGFLFRLVATGMKLGDLKEEPPKSSRNDEETESCGAGLFKEVLKEVLAHFKWK